MDAEQFQQFMGLLAATSDRPGRPSTKVSWATLSELSTAEPDHLDKWFVEFETLLTATRVPSGDWLEKFVECPKVPEHLKSRVREEVAEGPEFDYATLRRTLLTEFGPIEPVAFFKRKMHHLKCPTATEAKQQLTTLLELHNRAARDHEDGKLHPRSLCYCFMDALPPSLGQHLKANYALAAMNSQPLEQLFKMAKAKEDAADPGDSAFLTASWPDSRKRNRSPPPSPNSPPSITAALALLAQRLDCLEDPSRSGQPRGKASRSACQGCGGGCDQRSSCPAQDKECFRCHRVGHFGAVCKSGPPSFARPTFARSEPPQSQVGNRNFRRVWRTGAQP